MDQQSPEDQQQKNGHRTRIAFSQDTVGGDDHDDPNETEAAVKQPLESKSDQAESHVENESSHSAQPRHRRRNNATVNNFQRRKRGRKARRVKIKSSTMSSLPLPGNMYSTTLVRRATRKLEDLPPNTQPTDEYGDISLGMKLTVAGGKVIVQTLNPLADGKASPAQLTGIIHRGDVLVAVDNVFLDKLPIDQLMEGLKPLSTPKDGEYRRVLRLLFDAGAGHDLLLSHERGLQVTPGNKAPAADFMSFFPMVDQLSGAPLFDHEDSPHANDEAKDGNDNEHDEQERLDSASVEEEASAPDGDILNATITSLESEESPDELISSFLAKERTTDRARFSSEYFDWGSGFSKLLHATLKKANVESMESLSRKERIQLGQDVMKLARSLTYTMEDMDKGKDLRSFKVWSTNFSLKSSASARRRVVLDAASLRSHRQETTASTDMIDDSSGSEGEGSGSMGSVDGDMLLLSMAAHDEIWRKQIKEALQQYIEQMNANEDTEENESKEESEEVAHDINAALSNELGAFLFGDNMNKIIKKKKKSYALPPGDITTVLFDLTTHMTAAAPDEVTVFGGGVTTNSFSYQSTFAQGKAKAQLRTDIMLANRFILDEVLPIWLESFRPLGLEQRRLFWPKVRRGGGSTAGGTTFVSDDDSLTVDSHEEIAKAGQKAKNLQEMIEDLELDVETRSETCFLATYYFTEKILAKYPKCRSAEESEAVDKEVSTFVDRYGTYLQIHPCLVYSASVEAEEAMGALSNLARHDPTHRAAVKEIEKANDLTFYDAGMLSALIEVLNGIRYESRKRKNLVKNLCVAAYPDVQPWQVRKACLDPVNVTTKRQEASLLERESLYYDYLCVLLDPVDGNGGARHNAHLVKDWCQWSIGSVGSKLNSDQKTERLNNFFKVASRTSSTHLAYRRDLPTLLDMSMEIMEYGLSLELIGEVLESRKLCYRPKTLDRVMICLRSIASEALASAWKEKKDAARFHMLKRVLRTFQQMSTSDFTPCRECIDVPVELRDLLVAWEERVKTQNGAPLTEEERLALFDAMANESAPSDALGALALWSTVEDFGAALLTRINGLLQRGVQFSLKAELSGSLLRVKCMRRRYAEENKALISINREKSTGMAQGGIWKQLSIGNLSIHK